MKFPKNTIRTMKSANIIYKTKHKELAFLMYLDYVNDFLTVERFAEFYEITNGHAKQIIALGRAIMKQNKYLNHGKGEE